MRTARIPIYGLTPAPAGLPPPGTSGPYTYELCDDVDPTQDYENVLTD